MKHNGNLVITAENCREFSGLTEVGGSLYILAETSLPVLTSAHGNPGRLIAISGYGLVATDAGMFYAGCRGPLTKDQALAHWRRDDERAKVFTAAILGQP